MSTELSPTQGILDIHGNTAFLRVNGYVADPGDVHVPLSLIKRHGLRPGDVVTGRKRPPSGGKHDSLAEIDIRPERRPSFDSLTPLHPDERLFLETSGTSLTTRAIDLIMPIGKGQRALVVSPPKAGKTSVLRAVAEGIESNHPECHLMVLLVDERPEEVTDMRRTVHGEVIASTFDRPPAEHTLVAELAVERAKRLVEAGEDVVMLLDSITRLGRAYNLASRASGRILTGGVDAAALHPLKRLLGAARNIEHGGSLTIVATAMVENGSAADTLFFEELKSTGNAELKLDRKLAEKRVFPAVDIATSSTRREELLRTSDELVLVHRLRRALLPQEDRATETLLDRLRKTGSNAELLLQLGAAAGATRVMDASGQTRTAA